MKRQHTFPRKKDRAKKRRLKAELKQLARTANEWHQEAMTILKGMIASADRTLACLDRMNQRCADHELSDAAGDWATRAQSFLPN